MLPPQTWFGLALGFSSSLMTYLARGDRRGRDRFRHRGPAQHPHAEIRDRDRQERAREVEYRVGQVVERGEAERRGHVRFAAVPRDQHRDRRFWRSRRGAHRAPFSRKTAASIFTPSLLSPTTRVS